MHLNLLKLIIAFDWDEGNVHKSWNKHDVTPKEAEEIFTDESILLLTNAKHSEGESRYTLLGRTQNGRKLYAAFTIRKHKIRIISVRDMSRKERKFYEEEA